MNEHKYHSKSARILTWSGKLENWGFLLEFGVYFSNIHGMTLKIFFSGVGTIRRCKKKKFWIFNHFWLRYRSSKVKNHESDAFYGKVGFFIWSPKKSQKIVKNWKFDFFKNLKPGCSKSYNMTFYEFLKVFGSFLGL